MSNRYALVVAAQWGASGRHLDDLPDHARTLRDLLLDPNRGGCLSAYGDGLLLDPSSVREVYDAVADAFSGAAEGSRPRPATLMLTFLGHGLGVRDEDFLFPVTGSPKRPDRTTAYSVPAGLREGLTRNENILALAVLVDTCQSGVAALAAAREWIPASMERGREIAILTSASSDQPAYGLAFVRGVNRILDQGHARLGTHLYEDDVRWAVGLGVRGQQPQTVRHGGSYSAYGSPSQPHWITRNVAHLKPYSVLADSAYGHAQLGHLRMFQPPERLSAVLDDVRDHRAVSIVGRKGYGKSVLAAALCRPELRPGAQAFTVVAFCPLTSDSVEDGIVSAIARQLAYYLPEFTAAREKFHREVAVPQRDAMPPEQRLVAEPLMRCGVPAQPVRLVVDALDQLEPSVLPRLTESLCSIVDHTPDWFGIVATSRDGVALPDSWHPFAMPRATDDQLAGFLDAQIADLDQRGRILARAAGNWQIARLLVTSDATIDDLRTGDALYEELYEKALTRARRNAPAGRKEWVDAVLNVLGAAGPGPVLPRSLLVCASGLLGGPDTDVHIDQVLSLLPGLLSRVHDPNASEIIGIDHQTLVDHIDLYEDRLSTMKGHQALVDALATMAPMESHQQDDPLHAYAREAEPVHLWETGAYERVLDSLEQRSMSDAAGNRDRWISWCRRLAQPGRPGPGHRTTLRARQRAAYWAGRAGSYRASREMYEAVLADQYRLLDPDDEDVLQSRHRIAYAAGQTGRFAEAVTLHKSLLADQVRVLGPNDHRTMKTRHHIAYWTGRNGAMYEGLRLHEELLPHQESVLGPRHRDVLESRHYIAYWYGRIGRPEDALMMHERLLRDRIEVFGEDHEQVIFSKMNICKFTAEAGRLKEGLAAYRALLPDVKHHKSADHPDTLLVRLNIARFTWELGDPVESARLHQELLADQRRVNGERHPTVLITRHNLAWLHGELGDPARAVDELTRLYDERVELYGSAKHAEVLTTRLGIAWWRAASGELAHGRAAMREVLADRVEILGTGHPDVLDAQSRLGELLGRSHAVAEAIELLSATASEQSNKIGNRHPFTLTTRARLADVLVRAGRQDEVRDLLAALLPHQAEVFGPDHPHTVRTREALRASAE